MKSGPNLILNPGFEIPGSGGPGNVFANWVDYTHNGSTITQDPNTKLSGNYSARFNPVPLGDVILQQNVLLDPTKQYRFKLHHKESIPGTNVRRWDIRTWDVAWFLKEDGTWFNGIYLPTCPRVTQWATVQVQFYPHPSYTNYVLFPYAGIPEAGESIWFDDISISELIPGSPPYLTQTGIGS